MRPKTSPHERSRKVSIAAAVLAIATLSVGVGACSDSDSATASKSGDTPTTEAHSADHQPEKDRAKSGEIAVTAVDYSFKGLPDRIAAGSQIKLSNDAPAELHELVAFRLPDDEMRSVEQLMALSEAELGALLGKSMPTTVLLAPPGAEQITAVGNGTLTEPGRYLIMCSIPTGADPAEYLAAAAKPTDGPPQVAGGPPHFTKGMVTDIIVE
ncbi:MAG TPA: hypothetical protein VL068_09700 [Microthrixaceae bacterium]|nr:hypothetical protein [Microthrixaceae bacterium]